MTVPNQFAPAPSAPSAPSAMPSQAEQMMKLQGILDKYEVSIAEVNDLAVLQDYEIVFVADDSGSMQLSSVPPSQRQLGVPSATRWGELRETVRTVAEVACCLDADGVDVYFLNRPALMNVVSVDEPRFAAAFEQPPRGSTPLTEVIKRVVEAKSASEKPVLVLVATDGEPNGGPRPFKMLLQDAINRRITNAHFRFQILACTEDDEAVDWLNDFDDNTHGVDVTDDFYTEREQILKAGRVRQFRRSDWVVKALLGPVLDKYDRLDQAVGEAPLRTREMVNNDCGCAIM